MLETRQGRPHFSGMCVNNPEFLKEGDALADSFKPDRIVLGARNENAGQLLRELYAPLQLSGERVVMTDPCSSGTGYIRFQHDARDARFVRERALTPLPRYGRQYSCCTSWRGVRLAHRQESSSMQVRDTEGPAFRRTSRPCGALGKSHGVPMHLAEAAHRANLDQKEFMGDLIERVLGGVHDKKLALWVLAFKPETDDIRESPAVSLASRFLEKGATIVAHDPEAGANFRQAFGGRVTVTDRDYDALDGAHALVLLTGVAKLGRAPNFAEIRRRLVPSASGAPIVVDARNVWRPSDAARAGLRYQGVGVQASPATSLSEQRVGMTRSGTVRTPQKVACHRWSRLYWLSRSPCPYCARR